MLTESYLKNHQLRITVDTTWFVKDEMYITTGNVQLFAINENTLNVVNNKNYYAFEPGKWFVTTGREFNSPPITILEIQWIEKEVDQIDANHITSPMQATQLEIDKDWVSTCTYPARIMSNTEVIERDDNIIYLYQIEFVNEQF